MKNSSFKMIVCQLISLCFLSGCTVNVSFGGQESNQSDSSYSSGNSESDSQPCEHTYTWKTVLAPSCGRDGFKDGTCSKCGDTTTEHVDALTHSYKNGVCEHCNEPAPSDSAETTCKHEYEWEIVSEAECEKTGSKLGICSKCGAEKRQSIGFLGHSYVNGDCERCDSFLFRADEGDLSNLEYASSSIFNNWMTVSALTLQNDTVSENSTSAIKGTFNSQNVTAYQGNGGACIWTAIGFDLAAWHGVSAVDLINRNFSFDLKTENCYNVSALTFFDANGDRPTELAFHTENPPSGITRTALDNGWARFVVDLDEFFGYTNLDEVTKIALVFSNSYADQNRDSVFYIDNVNLSAPTWEEVPSVYKKYGGNELDESVSVAIVGNRVDNATTHLQDWLEKISVRLNATGLSVTTKNTENATMVEQYELAFGENGYMTNGYVPDIVFIQGFQTEKDGYTLGGFIKALYQYNPQTEVYILASEYDDREVVESTADYYGLCVADWNYFVDRAESNYSQAVLHDAATGDPNLLSGYFAGAMLAIRVYNYMLSTTDAPPYLKEASPEAWSLLVGETEQEKEACFSFFYRLMHEYSGRYF